MVSLFHELGHIVNGDIGKSIKFIDDGVMWIRRRQQIFFARDRLFVTGELCKFLSKKGDFYILKQSVVMHGLRM